MPKHTDDKPLHIILAVVGMVVLLMLYTSDLDASDVQVSCYTAEQVAEKERNVRNLLSNAYNYGIQQGMIEGYKRVVLTVLEQCSLPDVDNIVFKHPDGEILLTCPTSSD